MNIISRYSVLAVFAIALVSCSLFTEVEQPQQPIEEPEALPDSVSFTAVLERWDTKAGLSGLDMLWSDGDIIKVFTREKPQGMLYTISEGAGTAEGTFSGPNPGSGPYYAIFPPEAGMALNNWQITLNLPSSQSCINGSFDHGVYLAAGKASDLDGIVLRNALGTLELQVNDIGSLAEIRLYTMAEEALHGPAYLGLVDSDIINLRTTGNSSDSNLRTLTFTATGEAATEGPSKYYLLLPPGTLAKSYFVEMETADGEVTIGHVVSGSETIIERNVIRSAPVFTLSGKQKASFLRKSNYGAWENASYDSGELSECCHFSDDVSQIAWLTGVSSRYTCIQDIYSRYLLRVTVDCKKLVPGNTESASVMTLGNTGTITGSDQESVEIIKVFNGMVWMIDSRNFGYILPAKD